MTGPPYICCKSGGPRGAILCLLKHAATLPPRRVCPRSPAVSPPTIDPSPPSSPAGDTLKFSESPSSTRDSLTATVPVVPLDDTNLILKVTSVGGPFVEGAGCPPI